MLRLAFYQVANGPTARRVDQQLAAYYQHLMVERGHCHTKASVAIARKLAERIWTVLNRTGFSGGCYVPGRVTSAAGL